MSLNSVQTNLPNHTGSSFSRRSSLLWFAAIVALFAGTRLWRLTASCLWFDEIFSVHAARHKWVELFYFVAADIIHPPLFYALLKAWISLGGESLGWLRSLPALIGIASIVPFTLLCRELKLKPGEVNLALLLLAVNGYLIKYAQEVRMYSLLFFLSVCSLWLFFRYFNRAEGERKRLIALFAINLLLVYTHYAGWLLVALEVVALVVWQRRSLLRFLSTVGLLIAAYLPWIYEVVKVARSGAAGQGIGENIGWVTRPGVFDLVQYLVLLNRPFLFVQSSAQAGYNLVIAVLVFLLFGLPLLAFLWNTFGRSKTDYKNTTLGALSVFFLAPVVLAFLLSWLSPYSVWGTRHLMIAAGPYAILAALALKSLRPHWIRITALSVIGCWLLLSAAVFMFSRPTNFIWCRWEQLADQMAAAESNTAEPVHVYAYEDLVAYHLWFALNSKSNPRFKVGVVKGVDGVPEDPAYFLPRAFADISVQRNHVLSGNNIWVAFRSNRWDEARPPLNLIRSSGFQLGRVFTVKAQGQQAFLVQLVKTSN
ncbi:MAG: hypothetical protein AABN95_02680 [Acidobacteriota bacterium]